MSKWSFYLAVALTFCLAPDLRAASIWLDSNEDGLPDTLYTTAAIHSNVALDVWIDSETFQWSNYAAYVYFTPGLVVDSASYAITGGSNFVIDDYSLADAIGFGGYGYTESGVDQIGTLFCSIVGMGMLRVGAIVDSTVEPYSHLTDASSAYRLFDDAAAANIVVVLPEAPEHEPNIVLAKFLPGAVEVADDSTAFAVGSSSVTMSSTLRSFLESQGVEYVTSVVSGFDPTIVDREGEVVLDEEENALQVPHDLSLWMRLALDGDDVETVAAALLADSSISDAHPNYLVYGSGLAPAARAIVPETAKTGNASAALTTPNDPFFSPEQWGMRSTSSYNCDSDTDVRAEEGWDLDQGTNAAVKIAFLDTGLDLTHPDIRFPVAGADFIDGGLPNDDNSSMWHGTAVTGIATMEGNNSIGGAGVAWGVSAVAVKVLNSNAIGSHQLTVQGLNWARSQGIKIVNMSLGGPQSSSILREALRNGVAAGMTNLADMGNSNSQTPHYPAAYDAFAVGVNAQTHLGERWTDDLFGGDIDVGSGYGSWLDLTAPGGRGIMTTKNQSDGNGYYDLDNMNPASGSNDWINSDGFAGVAASPPFVAGIAAALMSANPVADGEDAERIIRITARDDEDYGNGWDSESGWGMPDLYGALYKVTFPAVIEHLTVSGGTVTQDLSGSADFYNIPGVTSGTHAFDRKKVQQTVTLTQYDYASTPASWGRVRGTIGARRITQDDSFDLNFEQVGYCETTSLSATSVRVTTYYYIIYNLDSSVAAVFPNDGNVVTAFTVQGRLDVTGVGANAPVAGAFHVRPNPASVAARIQFSALSSNPGRREIQIIDSSGRLVRRLFSHDNGPADWDLMDSNGHRVGTGVYLLRTPQSPGKAAKIVVVR